jgi:ketosteroid isomerase-like protein
MTESLVDLAPRFYNALGDADAEAALALAHEDMEMRIPAAPKGVPRLVTGRDGLAGMISNITRTWSDLSVEITDVHAYADEPNRGILEADVEATNCDGSRYANHYVVLVEILDGLIHRRTEYYDPTPVMGAIDALRAQARAASGGPK